MRISKKTHELIRQNERIVKKSQKHDANLQKNTTLYFQVGLIACLLAAYGLLEMKFETTIPNQIVMMKPIDDDLYLDVIQIKERQSDNKSMEVKKEKKKLPEEPKIVPDDVLINNFKEKVLSNTPIESDSFNPNNLVLENKPEESVVSFERVEQVPIYPGCETKSTNEAKRKCMSDKITKLVQRKFNTDLGSELGLSGKQVIHTQFKIDKTGHVTDIKVRGTHPELEKEAEHVINIIPNMIPGKQRNTPVGVVYSLPIVFKVQN